MAGTAPGKSAVAVSQAAALAAERPLAHPLSVAVAGRRRFAAPQAELAALREILAVAPALECVGELPECARPAEPLDHSVSRAEMHLESIGMAPFFAAAPPGLAVPPTE